MKYTFIISLFILATAQHLNGIYFENSKKESQIQISSIIGTYVFKDVGIEAKIRLAENDKAYLKITQNGVPIKGFSVSGKYELLNETELSIDWDNPAFNKTMGDLTYDNDEKTLKLPNGTIYKKIKTTTAVATSKPSLCKCLTAPGGNPTNDIPKGCKEVILGRYGTTKPTVDQMRSDYIKCIGK